MTKAEMRNRVRWILDQMGTQWLTDADTTVENLENALQSGIERYAEETEAFRVLYTCPTVAGQSSYGLGNFANPADPSANDTASNALRLFKFHETRHSSGLYLSDGTSTYPLRYRDGDLPDAANDTNQKPCWWYRFDQTTIVVGPGAPDAVYTLTADGYVTPKASWFLYDIEDTVDPAWLSVEVDQDLPCYWAAKLLAMRSPSSENSARISFCDNQWQPRIAKAKLRIHGTPGSCVMGRRARPRFGFLLKTDDITLNPNY